MMTRVWEECRGKRERVGKAETGGKGGATPRLRVCVCVCTCTCMCARATSVCACACVVACVRVCV